MHPEDGQSRPPVQGSPVVRGMVEEAIVSFVSGTRGLGRPGGRFAIAWGFSPGTVGVGWAMKRAHSDRFMMPARHHHRVGLRASFCLCRWKGLPEGMQNLSGGKAAPPEGAPMPLSDCGRDEDAVRQTAACAKEWRIAVKKWVFIGIAAAAILVWWMWDLRPMMPALSMRPPEVSTVVITTNGEGFPAGRIVITDKDDIRTIATSICGAKKVFYPADGCMYSMYLELVASSGSQTVIVPVCCFGSLKISGSCRYRIRSEYHAALRKVLAKYGFLWIPDRKFD